MGKSKFNKIASADEVSFEPPIVEQRAGRGAAGWAERGDDATATKSHPDWDEKQAGDAETIGPTSAGSSQSPASRSTETEEDAGPERNLEAILLSLLRPEPGSPRVPPTEEVVFHADVGEVDFSCATHMEDPPLLPRDTGIESLPLVEQSVYALQPAKSAPRVPPPPPYQAPPALPLQPAQYTNCYSAAPSAPPGWPPPASWSSKNFESMQSASAQAMLGTSSPCKGPVHRDASWHLAWCADYYRSQEHVGVKGEVHKAVTAKGGVVVPFWTPRAMVKWLNTRADVPYAMLTDANVLDTFVRAIASSGKNRPLRRPVHIFVFRYGEDVSHDVFKNLTDFERKGTVVQFNETGFRELASQCVLLVLGLC